MATVRQVQVTFDCAQPRRVARFWCEVLGYVPASPRRGSPPGTTPRPRSRPWSGTPGRVQRPDGVGPRLYFQRVPEGKLVKNRVHLDVRVGTGLVGRSASPRFEAERDRLVALGATCVRVLVADEENESCIVMQDVEGNEFCLD